MRSLLLKEWALYRLIFILFFAIMLYAALAVVVVNGPLSPVLVVVPFVWFIPISMSLYEFKNDSELLINSLPVTRREMVTSRYVSLFLFVSACICLMAIIQLLLQAVLAFRFFPASSVTALVFAFTGIGLFLSLYLPISFIASPKIILYGTTTVLLVGFIFLMMVAPHIIDWFDRLLELWQQFNTWQWSLVFCGVTGIVIALSWLLSIKIYEAKNL